MDEGAAPALEAHAPGFCAKQYRQGPVLRAPKDWRDWGFRNAMLRRSLAEIKTEVAL